MRTIWPSFKPATSRSHWLWRLLVGGALLLGPAAASSAATFTATLDRDKIIVGESATLTFKIEGGQPRAFPIPRVNPALQVNDQGSSQSFSVVNNEMSASVSQTYALTPMQPGEYTIFPARAEVGGQVLASQPLKLTVLLTDPSEPPAEFGTNTVFLWVALPKKEVYEGEPMLAELRLYVRNGVVNISDPQIPPLMSADFNSGKYVQGQQYQRQVGGVPFTVVPFQTSLTPVKNGQLTIGPLNGSIIIHLPSGQPRRPFDVFGGRTVSQQMPLILQPQTVSVLKLPPETPPGFNGAIGNYTITYSAGPTNLPAGDPITIKVQISGEGQFDTLTLPPQSWEGFKTYPANSHVETQDPFGLKGTKFFEQVVVPQNENIKQLPPVSFSFFDPAQKKYRTLSEPGVPLLVREGPSAVAPTYAAKPATPETPQQSQDIVHIKQRLGTVAEAAPELVRQPWFLAMQSVPLLALLSATVLRKRNQSLANNPRLRRQRQVARMMDEGVAELRSLAAAKQSDDFFAKLFHLLQEQLGERLNLPASAITEAVIEDHLRPRGLPETTITTVQELFQSCNLARYARAQTREELAAIIGKFEAAIRELREAKL